MKRLRLAVPWIGVRRGRLYLVSSSFGGGDLRHGFSTAHLVLEIFGLKKKIQNSPVGQAGGGPTGRTALQEIELVRRDALSLFEAYPGELGHST